MSGRSRDTLAHTKSDTGHWTLDHNSTAFDTEADIFDPSAAERERLAQLFASYFLMPPPLVHSMVARHRVQGEAISPAMAYLIARDMRVSYEAALRQMTNLDILRDHELADLIGYSRLTALQAATHGYRPQDGRADVWSMDERSLEYSSGHVDVIVDDEIVLMLPENRTTGYQWLDETANTARGRRQMRSAPQPFTGPSLSARTTVESPTNESPRRTAADINAALALLPPSGPVMTASAPFRPPRRRPPASRQRGCRWWLTSIGPDGQGPKQSTRDRFDSTSPAGATRPTCPWSQRFRDQPGPILVWAPPDNG